MIARKGDSKPPALGLPWLILCLSFAVNILDEGLHDFLGSYNPTVLTLYGHFSWFPRIDLTLWEWLAIVLGADTVLLLMTPWAFRNWLYEAHGLWSCSVYVSERIWHDFHICYWTNGWISSF